MTAAVSPLLFSHLLELGFRDVVVASLFAVPSSSFQQWEELFAVEICAISYETNDKPS